MVFGHLIAYLCLLTLCHPAQAHIGSPTVFFEGRAGEYPVQVVIRPPVVVPGLAEITVRVPGEPVQRVNVLPVFWNAGRNGAPPPDEAKLVRGETNLYSASLWLMKSGAYSVDVNIEGSRGKGVVVVPVNASATNTRPMSGPYRAMLLALGLALFLGGLKIAGMIFGESHLAPGAVPTKKDRWRGRAAVAVATLALALVVFGGQKWWDFEDREYRNNSLYAPVPVSAEVRTERDQNILRVAVATAEHRGQWTPLIPDHGKMMHLFLVRDELPGAFAHLHPVQRRRAEFEAPLPPLPAGRYHLYADVTHENGFAETLTAGVEVPPASIAMKRLWLGNSSEPICSAAVAQMLATKLFFPPDPDDSWQIDGASTTSSMAPQRVAEVGGGYRLVWKSPATLEQNRQVSLRFQLLTSDNQPALIEPYMGMLGHAVVRRTDGAVFAHIHPLGTVSMAAQEFFIKGKTPERRPSIVHPAALPVEDPSAAPPFHSSHTNLVGVAEDISFPYAFPQPGSYRLWVQTKSKDRILTGVFDTNVKAK